MLELLSLSYSPWSEKARWALEARHIEYEKRNYIPLVGEPGLRILLRKPFGPVSVPVLIDGRRVISGSFEIAKYADARGRGVRLFPSGSESTIADYDTASERGLSAGRALGLLRMLDDREALSEQVPGQLSSLLGPLAGPIAKAGVERTLRKYTSGVTTVSEHRGFLASVLASLRADLSRSNSPEQRTLLSEFSYADIVMAQVLCFVQPPHTPHVRMGPGSRRCFTDDALRTEFADLIAWRDALYAAHRH